MKRLITLVFLIPSLAFGVITRVQSKGASASASSLTITLSSATTPGNTLLVGICMLNATLRSVKHGSNSAMFASPLFSSTIGFVHLAYIHIQEASTTVVITPGTGGAMAAVAVEYTGTLIVPDIPPNGNVGQVPTQTTATTATTNYADELVVAVMGEQGKFAAEQTAWMTSPTNSFSIVAQTSTSTNVGGADRAVAFLERFVTSTATYSTAGVQATPTPSPSPAWGNIIATFTDNPTPTATATSTATATFTPTATATASFTPCAPTPTNTPTATPSDTPTPTATATASYTPCAICSGISRARADNPQ